MIATLLLAAATAVAPQTPQAAALLFLQPSVTHSRPYVRVAAASAHYAIVRFTGAVIESTPAAGYLLARKFSFGWQPIDLTSNDKAFAFCLVRAHRVIAAELEALRPVLSMNSKCSKDDIHQHDEGPTADVEAVRAQGAGVAEIIPFVRVVDGYAFMEWRGWGGGENFYKKTPQGWKRFAGGGGAMLPGDFHAHYGIPLAIDYALLKQ